jgi:hypothetical protein
VVVATTVIAVVLAACGGASHRTSGSGQLGSGRGAPTLSQVRTILDRHGRAVMSRSSKDFLADVDDAKAASDFRRRQAEAVGALAPVPLASWTYTLSAPVTDPITTAASAKRLGAPTLIVRVSLAYALRRVDPVPSTHDLWWTFVKRHGRVRIAADDDMANVGGASWHGPWDFGPLVVQQGRSSVVFGHPASAAQLPQLAAAVDAAVPVVDGVWGSEWTQQVAVIVPASAQELAALGQTASISDISAETVSDPPNAVTGAITGARVLMNPDELNKLTEVGRRIVVQHELAHVATAASTGPASPRWLVEGFAEYVGNLGSGQPVRVAAGELRAEVARGRLPAQLPGDAEFTGGSGPQAYEESWLACRLIVARAGQPGMARLYRLVGASGDTAARAVEAAMQSVLHESMAAFTAQWRNYLSAELA